MLVRKGLLDICLLEECFLEGRAQADACARMWVDVSYTSETMDNLTYAYSSTNNNTLMKVTDAALPAGFNNGTSGTNDDYTYDINGNVTSDKNKGMDSVKYNFLGKVSRVKFSDGKVITYSYDAAGSKLKMSTTISGTTTITDYVGGFVYT